MLVIQLADTFNESAQSSEQQRQLFYDSQGCQLTGKVDVELEMEMTNRQMTHCELMASAQMSVELPQIRCNQFARIFWWVVKR